MSCLILWLKNPSIVHNINRKLRKYIERSIIWKREHFIGAIFQSKFSHLTRPCESTLAGCRHAVHTARVGKNRSLRRFAVTYFL